VNDTGFATILSEDIADTTETGEQTPSRPLILEGNTTNCSSEELSEHATRSIFSWLRAGGYPACEKEIYEHPWIEIRDSDESSIADDSDFQVDN
jgi:hypothetical protein